MNTVVRLEDKDILAGVRDYRASVDGKYGPPTLNDLSGFIATGLDLDDGPSKANLSLRLNKLIDDGLLSGKRGLRDGLYTFTLDLTEEGRKVLEDAER